ncbi:FtsX-like permease family protein [Alkalihalobacillus trypoxylicola]|uniref:ABC transporter permease n=1 Tax=Alkalihalobacillus trypoxylicola TaxID=519424 RepID=A0A162DE76_9BACI|nr:ABC transporter permease [Alkalihalobacillus trypoxylicola]KYG29347.1 ABC transporter permease [Alkalihalobacillus trypoxylicola]
MTLFSLAIKNIRRNLKSYGLYIGSTIFSISIYFTFVTLKYSEDISALSESSRQISSMMNASSFVLLFFVSIFIIYSNSFFLKKRKKEMALYSLMGVRKRVIGWLLFWENIVIGLLSLVVGVAVGFFASQLLLALLFVLMGLEFSIVFAFSISAVVHTMMVFLVIFLLTSLQGYLIIYRFQLIELFNADKKGEAPPKARFISAILGIITISSGYWIAIEDITSSEAWRFFGISTPLVIIGLTILGSYLIFNSVLVYILHVLRKRKTWAWKGLNTWTTAQLLHRISGNARTLTIIAALSATTITAGGAVFGLYYNVEKNVQTYTPFTFMWEGEEEVIDSSDIVFQDSIESKAVRVNVQEQEMMFHLLDYSTFEKLAEQLSWSHVEELPQNQFLLIDPFYNEDTSLIIDSVMLDGTVFSANDVYTDYIVNMETVGGGRVIVLSDQQYEEIAAEESVFQLVTVDDYKNHLDQSNLLEASTENFSSAVQNYKDSMEANGSLLFVGSFLGLVFLVATGSVIYFKVMTEAEEDKAKYQILYKIGVTKKEQSNSIRHQVGMIFFAPLFLGLMHGAIALIAFSNLLQMNLVVPVLIWMLAYTFIYVIYYFATMRSYKKMVL